MTRNISKVIAVATCFAAPAHAATFAGFHWSVDTPVTSLADADAIVAAGQPTAIFASSTINYPGPGAVLASAETLTTFLGGDAVSIIGDALAPIATSVFLFRGELELAPGPHLFDVHSDDGFRLTIGGNEVSKFDGQRGFGLTSVLTDVGSGRLPFELLFFENEGQSGVEFTVDGVFPVWSKAAEVPLPASGSMAIAGLLMFGALRFRRG